MFLDPVAPALYNAATRPAWANGPQMRVTLRPRALAAHANGFSRRSSKQPTSGRGQALSSSPSYKELSVSKDTTVEQRRVGVSTVARGPAIRGGAACTLSTPFNRSIVASMSMSQQIWAFLSKSSSTSPAEARAAAMAASLGDTAPANGEPAFSAAGLDSKLAQEPRKSQWSFDIDARKCSEFSTRYDAGMSKPSNVISPALPNLLNKRRTRRS
mmetsp:Transcript_9696/g.26603  ORF Transcript_9696/g.26603 Transcript_9696/m.26603 type:complete len:214 (-) Transcript_9696:378-1019(-)